MIRMDFLAVIVAGVTLVAGAARAENAAVDNEDSRFAFYRTTDGFLRLDGRTGQVSICTRRPVGWVCPLVPDERSALEGEISRLQADNAALKKELLAHDLPLPAGVKREPPTTTGKEEPRVSLPSDAELNEVMTFLEKVWKRVVEMVVKAQREMMK
jgi:hypothetical protein